MRDGHGGAGSSREVGEILALTRGSDADARTQVRGEERASLAAVLEEWTVGEQHVVLPDPEEAADQHRRPQELGVAVARALRPARRTRGVVDREGLPRTDRRLEHRGVGRALIELTDVQHRETERFAAAPGMVVPRDRDAAPRLDHDVGQGLVVDDRVGRDHHCADHVDPPPRVEELGAARQHHQHAAAAWHAATSELVPRPVGDRERIGPRPRSVVVSDRGAGATAGGDALEDLPHVAHRRALGLQSSREMPFSASAGERSALCAIVAPPPSTSSIAPVM